MASKDIPGLVFSEVYLWPPAASYFPSAIPTSPALVDFHHLIEGRLPGDQRPLSWQMTYDRRALQISRGKPVTLGSLGWLLERTYISCKVNTDRPGPQTNGRISKCWGRAGSGTPMLPVPGSHCCPYACCRKLPAGISSIHLQVSVCSSSVRDWLSLLGLPPARKCEHGRKGQVCLTCIPWAA